VEGCEDWEWGGVEEGEERGGCLCLIGVCLRLCSNHGLGVLHISGVMEFGRLEIELLY
jgi:hypothetical protein